MRNEQGVYEMMLGKACIVVGVDRLGKGAGECDDDMFSSALRDFCRLLSPLVKLIGLDKQWG